MNISVITSTQSVYGTTFTQKNSKPVDESASGRSVGADRVSISEAARAMAEKVKEEEGGQVKNGTSPTDSSNENLQDVLQYLPESYNNLLPDTMIVCKLGAPTYSGPMLSPEEVKDQNEYVDMLRNVFNEERQNKGVHSNKDYQNLTKNNDKLIGEIYQAVKEHLAADPRAIELMKSLHIKTDNAPLCEPIDTPISGRRDTL